MRCASRPGLAAVILLLGLAAAFAARAEEPIALDRARLDALSRLPTLDGPPVTPAALEGRVVVLAFFASWCPPCHPEFEHLKRIDEVYRDRGTVVLAVNIFETYGGDDGGARLAAFLAGKAADFSVLGRGEDVAPLFGQVDRIPTLFVFGADGRPVLHFIHARGATKTHATFEEIAAAVRAAQS